MQLRSLLPALGLVLWSISGGAAVTVDFENPGQFRDASLDGAYRVDADDPVLRALGRHLQKLGERYLAAGETLNVEILDVDLAGRFEPWRPLWHGVRIMDGITWPMIRLRYTLQRDGRAGMSAEERIVDQVYLGRHRAYFDSDRLGYEKTMLDDWFRARFGDHRPPR